MHYLWLWACSPGFAGTAAVIAAGIAFKSNLSVQKRNHKADRIQWALDQIVSDDPVRRATGMVILEGLAPTLQSGSEQSKMVKAALEAVWQNDPVLEPENDADLMETTEEVTDGEEQDRA